jgi:hypothetical protein
MLGGLMNGREKDGLAIIGGQAERLNRITGKFEQSLGEQLPNGFKVMPCFYSKNLSKSSGDSFLHILKLFYANSIIFNLLHLSILFSYYSSIPLSNQRCLVYL